jgi:Sulfatase
MWPATPGSPVSWRWASCPADTGLAPRNPGVEAWDSLPDNQKRLAARLQEAFAAYLEHTDAQIGRLVTALENLGELDNTLFLLMSDNGASQEGGPFGVMHEMKYFNFLVETPDEAVKRIDDIGGPHSHANYPWGWAQAGNTPFKWYKQNTHEGGVHVPLIVHWPDRVDDAGGLRDQFHHVNDIVPTIYETLGIEAPATYRGLEQLPVSGVSMQYSFAEADEPNHKVVQYFEMMGHRAIFADGWKAVTRHQPGVPFEDDDWELYHLAEDRSECRNLAADLPDKVTELVELWWTEAEEYGVLPLDDRTIELFMTRYRDRSPHPVDRHYSYFPPMSPLPGQVAPALGGRGWNMAATIDRPAGAGGALYATGTENSGVSLFIQDDHLVFDYNCFGDHHVAVSAATVPVGRSVVGVEFRRTKKSGVATLVIDGAPGGTLEVPFAMTMISSVGPSIGYDHGSPVSEHYTGHFPFEGKLHRIDIDLVRHTSGEVTSQAENDERSAMARQ